MKGLSRFFNRFYIFKELWMFLAERKRWWLLPIILMLILLGVLIVLSESTALGPFIYAIF